VLKAEVSSKRYVFVFNTNSQVLVSVKLDNFFHLRFQELRNSCYLLFFFMKVSEFCMLFRVTGNSGNPFLISLCLS
jgi:hypothetical protein